MSKEKIFPLILIIINLVAGTIYFSKGDWKRGCYWLFAAGLNYCVSF
jgi:hypothetical protein